jgi:hypothetical protein
MPTYKVEGKHIFRASTIDLQMGTRADGTPNIVRQPGPMLKVEPGTLLDDVRPEELQAFPDRFQHVPEDQLQLLREQEAAAMAAREEADAAQAMRQAEAAVAQAEQQAKDAEAMAKEAHVRAEAVKKQAADRKELRAHVVSGPAVHSDLPTIKAGTYEAFPSIQGTDPGDVSGPAIMPQHVILPVEESAPDAPKASAAPEKASESEEAHNEATHHPGSHAQQAHRRR